MRGPCGADCGSGGGWRVLTAPAAPCARPAQGPWGAAQGWRRRLGTSSLLGPRPFAWRPGPCVQACGSVHVFAHTCEAAGQARTQARV